MKRLVEASGLGLWLWASVAQAQAGGAFHLDYEAPAQCPTAAAFAAKIEGHTPLARRVEEGEASRRFRAVFDTSEPAARGRLEIVDFDGTPSAREVEGRDCNEVADALALIAAIVIDPNARPAETQEQADASAAAAAKAAAAAARSRPVAEVTMPQPIPTPVLVPRPRPEQSEPLPLRLGVIFQAGAVTKNLAPKLGVALVYGIEALLDRDHLLAPSLRLSLYESRSGELSTPSGKARFQWTTARVSGCPVMWSWENLGVRPCLIGDFGRLVAEGYETLDGTEENVFWAALGAAGRSELMLIDDTLLLEIEAGVLFPLSRQRFYFAPDLDVYQIGPGGYALGGIGFRFL